MTEPKKRRGHGEGSIRPKGKGYEWRISVKVNGKSVPLSHTAPTEKQARADMQRAKVDAERGNMARRSGELGEYLEQWLKEHGGISASTRKKYGDLIRLHIIPGLGMVKVSGMTPAVLRAFYLELREGYAEKGKRPLGFSSRRQIHNILHAALGQAIEDKLLTGANPTDSKGLRPKQEKAEDKQVRAFTPEQAARFLVVAAAEKEKTGQVLAFLLLTGMRRGEALGLRWEKVDLLDKIPVARVDVQRTVSGSQVVETAPKTRHGRRVVPLSPEAVALLERVRARTAEERAALDTSTLAKGKQVAHAPDAYVFPTLKGSGYDPSNFTRVMQRICQAAGVPVLPVHGLRHTFASLAALRGVRIEVLSRILGHSDPGFTLRQYRHLYPEELAPVSLDLPQIMPAEGEGSPLGELLPASASHPKTLH